ncbi:WD40 repeat domain-containing protein [uncultured Deinococcus sp.]|uniref:WD40 repeat domain-containing protein n=1 Tax=uncultured Deinococcus sp. TaxID=158789 RepID=UPI0037496D3A
MKAALSTVLAALLTVASAQVETRIAPDPLLILGVAQDTAPPATGGAAQPGSPVPAPTSVPATAAAPAPALAGLVAVRGQYSLHVRLLDASTGELRRELWLPSETDLRVPPALSGDGRWLAAALTPDPQTREGRVAILSTVQGGATRGPQPLAPGGWTVRSGGLDGTQSLALSRDGMRLAAGNRNGYAQLWDWQAGKRIATIQSENRSEPAALLFSPDSRLFAPMFRGQIRTRIFDARTGDLKTTLSGVGVGTFSPDSLGFLGSRGRLVSLATGREVTPPAYLSGSAGTLGFSMDGRRVLVRGLATDGLGRDWLELRDAASGRTVGTLTRIADGYPEFLSPDGTSLLGGDGQGGVRILPIAPR